MDITRFVNSKDIREHLQAIRHPFDTVTAAYLVWQCRGAALEEKFAAWEEIIKTMPDSAIPRRPGMEAEVESVHEFLRDYMVLEGERLEDFPCRAGCVYGVELFFRSLSSERRKTRHVERDALFFDYESCLAYCQKIDLEGVEKYRIWKRPLGKADPQAESLLMTPDFQVLAVEAACSQELDEVFPSLWVDIPTPFRRGDILWDPSGEPGFPHWEESVPFVLDYCDNWDTAQMTENGIRPEAAQRGDRRVKNHRRHGDTSDMGAQGFAFQRERGFWDEFGGFANYLNLEHYPHPLQGDDQVLEPLSQFLKGKLGVRTLVNRVEEILRQEPYENIARFCEREYTQEGRELAGLPEEEEQE